MEKISLIPFGSLIKPHGLKGYISVRFFNRNTRLLNKEDKVFFDNDVNVFLTIKDINYNSKNNLIRFFDFLSRNEVKKFNKTDFYIDKNVFPKLSNNENYFIDFIDCNLFDQNDEKIGIIKDVIPIQKNDVLVVESINGEKMVPFAKKLIMFFDKDDRKLIMMIHAGIL
jgi:16S rRNA processing protein RimM